MDRTITSFSGNVNNIVSNWSVTSSLFKMDASSKQLHQAPVFGEDTDVIYLHSCDLNTIDLTGPSLQFLRVKVVFGQFIFVSSLLERR